LLLLVLAAVILMVSAALLQSRRQYDAGTIPSTGEHPNARAIRGPFGLHLALQRGQLIGWGVGLLLAGLAFGSMTESLLDAARGNELLARVLDAQGTDGVYTTMTQFLAAAASGYVVSAMLRLHADEQNGLAEPVLAGAVSRWHWLLSGVGSTLLGAAVLMFCAGVGNGLGAGLTVGGPGTILRLTLAGLAFLPALAVLAGIAALAVALRTPWIGWLAVIFVVTSLYLGALLRLPHWLLNLSPIGQTTLPSRLPAAAMVTMLVAATVLTAAAGVIYRNRDAV
jgi:ABC-2 type transport system permease protein